MLAETAELAVILKLKDQLSGGLTAAQAKLGGLEASASAASVGGMTRLQKATAGVSTALGHAKSQLSGLVGGLGLLAGGAVAFGVFGALEQGVKKVEDMGLAVEKLTGVTGLSVHSASQLVAVFEKFGVDTSKATTVAAFAEKTLGKLDVAQGKVAKSAALMSLENTKLNIAAQGGSVAAVNKAIAEQKAADALAASGAAVSKLTALDLQYGLQLVDSKGKVVDFATELGQVADFYVSNASAADKAAVAAQLFGRGYVALIPILKLGSKGIAEAAAEADKLGVTLKSAEDIQNVQKFIDIQRQAREAIGGLEMQLALVALPDLTTGLFAFRDFIVNNRSGIEGGFRSLMNLAEQIGGAFTHVVIPAISAIGGVWNSLPGPIKELLIGGFLANKAIKWTFGIDVAGLAGGALKGAIEGLFRNATTASMSVQAGVVNVAGAGLPGGGESPVATGAKWTGVAGVVAAGATVAAGAGIGAVAIDQYMQASSHADAIAVQTGEFVKTATLDQLKAAREAVLKAGQELISQPWNPIAPAAEGGLGDTLAALNKAIDEWKPPTVPTLIGEHSALGDAIVKQGNDTIAAYKNYREGERQDLGNIAGLIGLTNSILYKEWGSAAGKIAGITARSEAAHGGKAPTQSAVDRTFTNDLLTQAKKIESDGHTTASKIADLQRLQALTTSRGDTATAAKITAAIAALKTAVDRTTAAIVVKQFTVRVLGAVTATGEHGGAGSEPTPAVKPKAAGTPTGEHSGAGNAGGILGMTRGLTNLGYAGEAGNELVTVLRNPRPLQAPATHLTVRVQVSNRQNETASGISNRIGPTPVHQGAQ